MIDGLEIRVFPNDYKRKDNAPDMVGNAEVNGDNYKISAWVNEFKGKGGQYLTIRFSKKLTKEEVEAKKSYENIKKEQDEDINNLNF